MSETYDGHFHELNTIQFAKLRIIAAYSCLWGFLRLLQHDM